LQRGKQRGNARVAALLCAALLPSGCQHLGPLFGLEREHCEGQVVRAGPYEARRLHVRAELLHKGESRRYEAVLELGPEGAALVGLTPFGTRAFVVRPREGGLQVDNRVGRYLGQSPPLLFDAVVRAWLAPEPGPDAVRNLPRAEERVAWREGERVFLSADAEADAKPGARVTLAGNEARVTNHWCRYDARLIVVSDTQAPDAAR
jgi:PAS domain-containing protein